MNPRTLISFIIINIISLNPIVAFSQNHYQHNPINSFSFDLYKNYNSDGDNTLLSPISAYFAILLAYEGSKDKTKEEIETVLRLGNHNFESNKFVQQVIKKSQSCSFLNIANAIWIDNGINEEPSYRDSVTMKYLSDFKPIDFNSSDTAAANINNWVSTQTNKRINEIISPNEIYKEQKMVIANAVYFNGEWHNKFEKHRTSPSTFYSNSTNQYTIDFMSITENISYYENNYLQFISKPYKNASYSFCLILPKKLFGLKEIDEQLNNDLLNEVIENSRPTKIELSIPRIDLEISSQLDKPLKQMGLQTAFTSNADFSGIAKESPLMLDKILHKTLLLMDEEKTETAAATVAKVKITGISKTTTIKADHPFVFLVMDNETRTILFMGSYYKPSDHVKTKKEQAEKNLQERTQKEHVTGKKNLLYVVNNTTITLAQFQKIKIEDIKSIDVITDKTAVNELFEGNYDGAIIITLKEGKD